MFSQQIREIGFDFSVFDIAFHPLRDLLAVGLVNGTFCMYDTNGKLSLRQSLPSYACRAVTFDTCGQDFISAFSSGTIHVLDIESGMTKTSKQEAHSCGINTILCEQHYLFSGDDNGTIKIWDDRNYNSLFEFPRSHFDYISAFLFSPSRRLQALKLIVDAPRGASWLYIVAAPEGGFAVEAGASMPTDPLLYPPEDIKSLLPEVQPMNNGCCIRWLGEPETAAWNAVKSNKGLVEAYACEHREYTTKYNEAAFEGPVGNFINSTPYETNCPGAYYMSPPRLQRPDVLVACNQAISPAARICGMFPWAVDICQSVDRLNDLQWRYDELCVRLNNALPLSWDSARQVISFLSPAPGFPFRDYYVKKFHYTSVNEWKTIYIPGVTVLFDNRTLRTEAHYGFFGDEWVHVEFGRFLENTPVPMQSPGEAPLRPPSEAKNAWGGAAEEHASTSEGNAKDKKKK